MQTANRNAVKDFFLAKSSNYSGRARALRFVTTGRLAPFRFEMPHGVGLTRVDSSRFAFQVFPFHRPLQWLNPQNDFAILEDANGAT